MLRPETVESLFILKTVTEKPHYQEWAWEIFRAFHKHSIVEGGGYANLDSCLQVRIPLTTAFLPNISRSNKPCVSSKCPFLREIVMAET